MWLITSNPTPRVLKIEKVKNKSKVKIKMRKKIKRNQVHFLWSWQYISWHYSSSPFYNVLGLWYNDMSHASSLSKRKIKIKIKY